MTSSVGSGFQTIQSWEEVAPFAGRVVAYQTDSVYFGATKGYTVENIHFGHISEFPIYFSEKGYNMVKVLKPGDVPGNCVLVASKLKLHISMRLATKEEIGLIGKAITADQATFEYMFDKERMNAILERHLEPRRPTT